MRLAGLPSCSADHFEPPSRRRAMLAHADGRVFGTPPLHGV